MAKHDDYRAKWSTLVVVVFCAAFQTIIKLYKNLDNLQGKPRATESTHFKLYLQITLYMTFDSKVEIIKTTNWLLYMYMYAISRSQARIRSFFFSFDEKILTRVITNGLEIECQYTISVCVDIMRTVLMHDGI